MAGTSSGLSEQELRTTAAVVARAFGQSEEDVLVGRHGIWVARAADVLERGIHIPSERLQLARVQARPAAVGDDRQQVFQFGVLHHLAASSEGIELIDRAARASIQSFRDHASKTAVMLADRVTPDQALNVLLHEIVRSSGRKLLDPNRWQQLMGRLHAWGRWRDDSRERAIYASASVRAARALTDGSARYEDELFAYAVEAAIDLGVKPKAQALEQSAEAWLECVSTSVARALHALAPNSRETLTAGHLVDLAYAMAQMMSPTRAAQILEHVQSNHPQLLERLTMFTRTDHSVFVSLLEERIKAMQTVVQSVQAWIFWLEDARRSGSKLEQEVHWSGLGAWLGSLDPDALLARDEILWKVAHSPLMLHESVARQMPTEDPRILRMERSMQLLALHGFDLLDDDSGQPMLRSRATQAQWRLDRPVPELPGVPERVAEIIWALMPDIEAGVHRQAFEGVSTRYHLDQLPGAKNYREIELRLPANALGEKGAYRDGRTGQVNVVLTLCVNERVSTDGRKVLFVEGIHSAWAADARAHGVRGSWNDDWRIEPIGRSETGKTLFAVVDKSGTPVSGASTEREDLRGMVARNPPPQSVPDAPFIKNRFDWTGLAIRRALREACDCGVDVVAFLDGETYSRRRGLRMRFDEVKVRPLDHAVSRMEMVMRHAGIERTMQLRRRDIASVLEPHLSPEVLSACASGRTWEGRRVQVSLDAGEALTHYDSLLPHTVTNTLRGQGIRVRDLAFALGKRKVGSYCVRKGADDLGWLVRTEQGLWLSQSGDTFDWAPASSQATAYDSPLSAQLAAAEANAEQIALTAVGINESIRERVSLPMPLMGTAIAGDATAPYRERGMSP